MVQEERESRKLQQKGCRERRGSIICMGEGETKKSGWKEEWNEKVKWIVCNGGGRGQDGHHG